MASTTERKAEADPIERIDSFSPSIDVSLHVEDDGEVFVKLVPASIIPISYYLAHQDMIDFLSALKEALKESDGKTRMKAGHKPLPRDITFSGWTNGKYAATSDEAPKKDLRQQTADLLNAQDYPLAIKQIMATACGLGINWKGHIFPKEASDLYEELKDILGRSGSS